MPTCGLRGTAMRPWVTGTAETAGTAGTAGTDARMREATRHCVPLGLRHRRAMPGATRRSCGAGATAPHGGAWSNVGGLFYRSMSSLLNRSNAQMLMSIASRSVRPVPWRARHGFPARPPPDKSATRSDHDGYELCGNALRAPPF